MSISQRPVNVTPSDYEILRINALKLLDIVRRTAKESCCICKDRCLSCDALDLLKHLGEMNEQLERSANQTSAETLD